ncbi:Toll/interleukin-1 receptor domain-containing protein [Tanacetum coccineum]
MGMVAPPQTRPVAIPSKIVQLWEDGEEKVLNNLRFLTIRSSKLRTFDLRLAPNLEKLTISNCRDFVELLIPADHLSKLEYLDLSHSKLTNLHLRNTPNLKTLILHYCNNLVLLPELGRVKCLKELNIRKTGIRRLPRSIFQLKGFAAQHFMESKDHALF